jgi:hypothetical protein
MNPYDLACSTQTAETVTDLNRRKVGRRKT